MARVECHARFDTCVVHEIYISRQGEELQIQVCKKDGVFVWTTVVKTADLLAGIAETLKAEAT
ncbi:MAG: hypothetical protein AB7G28_26200 [Pirellulales bacterium]